MIELSNLIHWYYDLNKICENISQEKRINFEEQVKIYQFYKFVKQEKFLDGIIKNKLIAAKTEDYTYLLSNLIIQLKENISLYSKNIVLFKKLPIKEICDYQILKSEIKITRQEEITSQFRKNYNKSNTSLESTAYGNFTEIEIHNRAVMYNESKIAYVEKQKNLKELFLEKCRILEQNCHYDQNYFTEIYELSNMLHQKLASEEKLYFDKGLIYSIYIICNNKIFESANEEDYQKLFNSSKLDVYLIKKPGSQNYICSLIKFLSGYVENFDKNQWIESVLIRLNIDKKNVFDKKKNEIENQAKTKEDSLHKKAKLFNDKLNIIKGQLES